MGVTSYCYAKRSVETGYITNREEEDYLNSEKDKRKFPSGSKRTKRYITWLKTQAGTATGKSHRKL